MTASNTVTKIKRRKVRQLQGLNMSILEDSHRSFNSNVNIKSEVINTDNFNTFSKIARRKYGELDGLLIRVIENSKFSNKTTLNGLKIVNPIKKYSSTIKLIFRYSQNTKY